MATTILSSKSLAMRAVMILTSRSQSFSLMPLPDDYWEVTTKDDESVIAMIAKLKKEDSDGCSDEIQLYVVASACEDQEETFLDLVAAKSSSEAAERIAKIRDYAFVDDNPYPLNLFVEMAAEFTCTTIEEAQQLTQELAQSNGVDDEVI